MNTSLPTANELEKLPMRAVVAYAARTTRRLSAKLRGIIADDLLDDALRLIDSVAMTGLLGDLDQTTVIRASEHVVVAFEAAPEGMKSLEKCRILFSLVQAALAAMCTLGAAADPSNRRHQMERAARAAQRAARPIETLSSTAAWLVIKAARMDYETLLQQYGEHEEVIIGDPVLCFGGSEEL